MGGGKSGTFIEISYLLANKFRGGPVKKITLYDFALRQILGTLGQVAYLGAGAPQDAAAAAVCRVCQFLCSRSLPSRARKSWSQICCLNYILFASITITLHKFGNISSRRILITGKINILCVKMNILKATSGRQRHRNCIIDVVGGFMAGFRYRFDQGEPSNMKKNFFPQPAGPPPMGGL